MDRDPLELTLGLDYLTSDSMLPEPSEQPTSSSKPESTKDLPTAKTESLNDPGRPHPGREGPASKGHNITRSVFSCPKCPATFEGRGKLSSHVLSTHQENKIRCHLCQQVFQTTQQLCRHLSAAHNLVVKNVKDEPRFKPEVKREPSHNLGVSSRGQISSKNDEESLTSNKGAEHQVKSFKREICSKSINPHQTNLVQHDDRQAHWRTKRGSRPPVIELKGSPTDFEEQIAEFSTRTVIEQIEELQREIEERIVRLEDRRSEVSSPTVPRSHSPDCYGENLGAKLISKPSINSRVSAEGVKATKTITFPVARLKLEPSKVKAEAPDPGFITIPDNRLKSPAGQNSNCLQLSLNMAKLDTLELFSKMLGPLKTDQLVNPLERKKYLCKRVNLAAAAQSNWSCHTCNEHHPVLGSLLEHMWRAHGEKKYFCEICQKCYGQKRLLCDHISRVHGSKDLFCDLCGKSFVQNWQLQNHVKNVHRRVPKVNIKYEM